VPRGAKKSEKTPKVKREGNRQTKLFPELTRGQAYLELKRTEFLDRIPSQTPRVKWAYGLGKCFRKGEKKSL